GRGRLPASSTSYSGSEAAKCLRCVWTVEPLAQPRARDLSALGAADGRDPQRGRSSPGYRAWAPGPARLPPPGDAHGRGPLIREGAAELGGFACPGVLADLLRR